MSFKQMFHCRSKKDPEAVKAEFAKRKVDGKDNLNLVVIGKLMSPSLHCLGFPDVRSYSCYKLV